MDRLVQIGQLPNGRWRVYSRTGKNLGTFPSRRAAQRRATQFERFIKMNRKRAEIVGDRKILLGQIVTKLAVELKEETPTTTYSSLMRELRQTNPEKVKEFMRVFKEAFDLAVEQGLEDLEQVALLETIHKLELNHEHDAENV